MNPIRLNKGDRFGNLVFIKETRPSINSSGHPLRRGKFKCLNCDSKNITGIYRVRSLKPKTCRKCYQTGNTKGKIHGLARHPLYRVWHNMIQRCYNKNSVNYKYYGGRGVIVSKKWKNNPEAFIKWALKEGWHKGLEVDKDFSQKKIYGPKTCILLSHLDNMRQIKPIKLKKFLLKNKN